jgi:predicted RNA-binding protein YlxR (DUF448 family)
MPKKVPLRMCIACRQMQEKKNLVRIVKNKDNEVFIDSTFKANGRGAYICSNPECFDKCIKTKALNRAFKCEISNEVLENLKNSIVKTTV